MIYFNSSWKNICISVSGGADSALLAYLVCSEITQNTTVHILSHVRMWKTRPWQRYDSINVYNWLVDRFPFSQNLLVEVQAQDLREIFCELGI